MLEKKSEKKDLVTKQKAKAISIKHRKNKRKISLPGKNKKNYNSNIADNNTDSDQINNKNLFLDCNDY